MEAKDKTLNPWHRLYDRQFWRNPKTGLKAAILRRDPICRVCERSASTVAHHVKDHRGNWLLFSDDANLIGVCKPCHDKITASQSGGFGNPRYEGKRPETSAAVATGTEGKQFQSSSVKTEKLDAALAGDVAELLKDIPE